MEEISLYELAKDVGTPLVSAIIGGLIALRGVVMSERRHDRREEMKERDEMQAMLKSIKAEIKGLWDRYMETAGESLVEAPDDMPFHLRYPVSGHTYFQVFDSQASVIGRIEDDNLRGLIIEVYIKAKGLVDSFKFNNGLCEEFERANQVAGVSQRGPDMDRLKNVKAQMIHYVGELKRSHHDLDQKISKLVEAIDEAT